MGVGYQLSDVSCNGFVCFHLIIVIKHYIVDLIQISFTSPSVISSVKSAPTLSK